MCVENQRHIAYCVLDALEQLLSLVGAHGTSHILQADGLEAHALEFPAHFDILFYSVHRALGVADTAGSDGVLGCILHRCVECGFTVPEIVQRIEDTDDVNSVFNGKLDELFYHVIMIVLIAQQILAAQQHLELVVRQIFPQLPQALPRIFVQIAQAGVKCCTAPAFNGIIPRLIHYRQNVGIICIGQSGCHQGLIGIPQNSFCKLHLFHERYLLFVFQSNCT